LAITLGKWREIAADKSVVKYGYGEDLISALKKIEKEYRKANRGCTGFCRTLENFIRFFDEHPSLETRTRKILEKMDEVKDKTVTQIKSWVQDMVTSEEN
jgi:Zn-dependent protease with chaperone function